MKSDDVKVIMCPVCDKQIITGDKKYMVALEKPYMNLYFHSDCYGGIDNLYEFINEYVKLSTLKH